MWVWTVGRAGHAWLGSAGVVGVGWSCDHLSQAGQLAGCSHCMSGYSGYELCLSLTVAAVHSCCGPLRHGARLHGGRHGGVVPQHSGVSVWLGQHTADTFNVALVNTGQ